MVAKFLLSPIRSLYVDVTNSSLKNDNKITQGCHINQPPHPITTTLSIIAPKVVFVHFLYILFSAGMNESSLKMKPKYFCRPLVAGKSKRLWTHDLI